MVISSSFKYAIVFIILFLLLFGTHKTLFCSRFLQHGARNNGELFLCWESLTKGLVFGVSIVHSYIMNQELGVFEQPS